MSAYPSPAKQPDLTTPGGDASLECEAQPLAEERLVVGRVMHERNVRISTRTVETEVDVDEMVRDHLVETGIFRSHIVVIPDAADEFAAGTYRADHIVDELHDLAIPEDDVRVYQQVLRRGDHVVSASADEAQATAPPA